MTSFVSRHKGCQKSNVLITRICGYRDNITRTSSKVFISFNAKEDGSSSSDASLLSYFLFCLSSQFLI